MKEKQRYEYIIHLVLFSLVIILLFKLMAPLATILLSSVVITYVSYPLYLLIKKKTNSHPISAIIALAVIVLIFSIPFSYFVYEVTQESVKFYRTLSGSIEEDSLLGVRCINSDNRLCNLLSNVDTAIGKNFKELGLDTYIRDLLNKFLTTITNYLVKIPAAILGAGISLIIIYFLYKDGESILHKIASWLPFKRKTTNELVKRFKEITYTIVFVEIFVAIIQGAISVIGYYIFDLPLPLFWGALTAFAALLPLVGTALIWFPASLFLILEGYLSSDYALIAKGFGLMIYGAIIISFSDNILRIKIAQARAKIHPIVTLIGIIGGVSLFGIMGLILGPIVLSLIIVYLENFREKFK